MRARFCKSTCKSIHHRATKQQATPTEETQTTTMRGNTMSNIAPMLHVFQESEFERLCTEARLKYENQIESPVTRVKGAIVEYSIPSIEDAFVKYHELLVEGFSAFEPSSPLPSVQVAYGPMGALVTLYMLKPRMEQISDLQLIYGKVRAQYEKDLEVAFEEEIERQVQLSLDKDERDRQLALEEERLKRAQATRDEMAESRAKLREQLIQSSRLNQEGNAK
jgi:hypothetical protein